jgi:hypothetical protein
MYLFTCVSSILLFRRYATLKASAAAARSAADKSSTDAAAALRVKRAKDAIASAAKAAAQKAAARAASAKSKANATARMLGSSNVASIDTGKDLKLSLDSDVTLNNERVKNSRDNDEVKFYRGNECSMAVIFPDDREFALACARVRKARST